MWAALRVTERPDNNRHGCARVILRATSVSMLVLDSLWQRATPVLLQRAKCNGTNNPNERYTPQFVLIVVLPSFCLLAVMCLLAS